MGKEDIQQPRRLSLSALPVQTMRQDGDRRPSHLQITSQQRIVTGATLATPAVVMVLVQAAVETKDTVFNLC